MIKYNFSGHPVPGFELAFFIGREFPSDGTALVLTMRDTLLQLPHRNELLLGEIPQIVLPGLSQAAAVLLAEWHGQFGNFPRIQWATRRDNAFVYPAESSADLSMVRAQARSARSDNGDVE